MPHTQLRRPTIFISSPSDVREERHIAKEVVRETVAELLLEYDVYDWNDEFLSAGRTFQDQIPSLTDPNCRLTICIFGERIGEPIDRPAAELRAAGGIPAKFAELPLTLDEQDHDRVPLTGSVYEYLEARLADQQGTGCLLLFAKGDLTTFDRKLTRRQRRFGRRVHYRQVTAGFDEGSPEYERERVHYFAQTDALGRFYDEIVGQRPAVIFQTHHEFRTRLRQQLRAALKLNRSALHHRQLFKGLESFSPRDHDALFGRKADARSIIQILSDAEISQSQFPLLVLRGKSGAGKSSLAKAGVAGGLALKETTAKRRFAAVDADVIKLSNEARRKPRTLPWLARLGLFVRRLARRPPRQDWSPIVHLGRRIALSARLKKLQREVQRNAASLDAGGLVALVRDFLADEQKISPTGQQIVPVIVLDQFEEQLSRTNTRAFRSDWLPVLEALVELARLRLVWVIIPLPSEAHEGDSSWPQTLSRLPPLRAVAETGLSTVAYELAFPQELERRKAIIKGPFDAIGRPLADAVVDRILDEVGHLSDQNDVPVLPLIAAMQRWIYDRHSGTQSTALRTLPAVSWPPAAEEIGHDEPTATALETERATQLITMDEIGSEVSLATAIDELGNAALDAFSFGEEAGPGTTSRVAESEEVLGRLLDILVDVNPPDDPAEDLKPRDIHLRWVGITDPRAVSRHGEDVVELALLLKETRILSQVRTDSVRLIHQNVLWHWNPAVCWRERRVAAHHLQAKLERTLTGAVSGRLATDLIHEMEALLANLPETRAQQPLRLKIVNALKVHFLALPDGAEHAQRFHAAITARCSELIEFYLDHAIQDGRSRCSLDAPYSEADPTPPLVRLADARLPDLVLRFLAKGADATRANAAGRTVVHALAAQGQHAALEQLLASLPAEPRARILQRRTHNHFTPLHLAARHGADHACALLLRIGADPLAESSAGSIPLHLAAYAGHQPAISALLAVHPGLQVGARDASGHTALMICASRGHRAALEALLAVDPSPFAKLPPQNLTALHLAAREGHASVVTALLSHDKGSAQPLDTSAHTPLHHAVLRGDSAVVEALLTGGVEPDPKSEEGVTPLILACQADDMEISRRLLAHGADPTWQSEPVEGSLRSAFTPLREAVRFGSRPLVELLLQRMPEQHTAHILQHSDALGLVPLHHAAYFGHLETIPALLAAGAMPDIANASGFTPLHLAAMAGQAEAAALLIHRSAPNRPTDKGRTPLHWAARNGSAKVVEVLLEQEGISHRALNEYGQAPVHLAAFYGHDEALRALLRGRQHSAADLDRRDGIREIHAASHAEDNDDAALTAPGDSALSGREEVEGASVNTGTRKLGGRTALYSAAQSGSLNCVQLLLEAGADTKISDANGNTPLHAAARLHDTAILEQLLSVQASSGQTDPKNDDQWTPLHNAAREGIASSVSRLLAHGADPRARTRGDLEPLHLACMRGHTDAARILIDVLPYEGLAAKNAYEQTALHLAARSGAAEIVQLLVAKQVGLVDERNEDNGTPLHAAALHDHSDIVRLLAASGADLNAQARRGSTPLELASFKGHLAAVQTLLELGADPNAADAMHSTPMHSAAYHDHPDVVAALLGYSADPTLVDYRGLSAAQVAARAGRVAVLEVFLSRVPLAALIRIRGTTLLHTASAYASPEAVDYLLRWRGRSLERFDVNEANAVQRTPLHFAAYNPRPQALECVRLLLEAGADLTCADDAGDLPAHYAALQGSAESFAELMRVAPQTAAQPNNVGLTPLHVAVAQRRALHPIEGESGPGRTWNRLRRFPDARLFEAVRPLPISHKSLAANGEAPIHFAIRQLNAAVRANDARDLDAHAAVLRVLAQCAGALAAHTSNRLQPLHLAAQLGSRQAVAILLSGPAKPPLDAGDATGLKPVHIAAEGDHGEIIEQLSAAGANLDAVDGAKRAALHVAAHTGKLHAAAALLKCGANVHFADHNGATPLHLACESNTEDMVALLLRAGAKPSQRTNQGRSALHTAALRASAQVVALLLTSIGSRPNASRELPALLTSKDSSGNTAVDCAQAAGNGEAAKLLVEAIGRSSQAEEIHVSRVESAPLPRPPNGRTGPQPDAIRPPTAETATAAHDVRPHAHSSPHKRTRWWWPFARQ